MTEADNLKRFSELFASSICHEFLVDESVLQLQSPIHDEVQLPTMGIFQDSFKSIPVMYENKMRHAGVEFHPLNFEPTRSEIESNLYAESFNHFNPEGLVVEHAIGTSSRIEAGCSYLDTRDDLGHQAVTQHADKKPHECNICEKTFKFKRHLDMHLISHESHKPHTCDICNKSFKWKSELRRHKLAHDNESTFQCDICNEGFKTNGDLVNHKLIHSDETLYKCDICNKNFKAKKNLRHHKIMHSDHRPYECDSCNRRFKRNCNLQTHKLSHDKESKMSAKSVAQPLKRHFI